MVPVKALPTTPPPWLLNSVFTKQPLAVGIFRKSASWTPISSQLSYNYRGTFCDFVFLWNYSKGEVSTGLLHLSFENFSFWLGSHCILGFWCTKLLLWNFHEKCLLYFSSISPLTFLKERQRRRLKQAYRWPGHNLLFKHPLQLWLG